MTEITFQNFDKFERSGFADRLTTVIKKFFPFYDEAFVLSLNAKYGSGKTTFLKMWKDKLEIDGNQVIYINAWETDFDDEPILPIVSAILSDVSKTTLGDEVKGALKTAIGATALAANSLFDKITGIDVKDIAEAVEKDQKSKSVEAVGEDLYAEYSYKKKAFEELREKLSDFANALENKPLVIIVDELDRVRPDYAVRFLEAIKHLFSVKGLVFVLAVDRKQLEISIRQLYGDIDFENYYRRFITREANLPDVHKVQVLPFLQELSKNFFDEKRADGLSFPFEKQRQPMLLEFIADLCKTYRLLPREIESFFRIFSQFMLVYTPEKVGKQAVSEWVCAAATLIAIYIKDQDLYHLIGKQKATTEQIMSHINSLDYFESGETGLSRRENAVRIFGACISIDDKWNKTLSKTFLEQIDGKAKSAANWEEDTNSMIHALADPFGRRYGTTQSCFFFCYNRLEEWLEFIG
ncbi:MAG: hypothetical protein AUJ12_08265 [Alphaproteobacteria bacterium CG1_02_46_17]|nr:MAG: hypothetical protein AUJ12_08265 [Alphaproteobacteria bacterium CG1_02_46_17]